MTDTLKSDKPKLLLHACCAPCSPHVLNLLREDWDVVLFFYNPNIEPQDEWRMRLEEMEKLSEATSVALITGEYDNDRWRESISGLESELEGGRRCEVCFRFRLESAASEAARIGASHIATTLSVSPHKNAVVINEQGANVAKESGIGFLRADFKKNDGYKKSCELSRIFGFRRQNYCGCSFSKRD
jgi:hypothetical protein